MPRSKPHLFDRLCDSTQLEKAWLEVLGHYAKGRYPREIAEFDRRRSRELARLSADLRKRVFIPQPASIILIPKPNHAGEQRPISLTGPDDRIVLTALNRLLNPLFERQFRPHSFAYRPRRGTADAIRRVTACLGQGLVHTAAGDIDDFFSSIDRQSLFKQIRGVVWESPLLDLIETYLHMGAERDCQWLDSGRGIAQGSPLSPLLSNIALSGFDSFLDGLGAEWVRYADNILLLSRDSGIVRDCFARAEAYLREECGFRLNTESRHLGGEADGFEFLGFWFCQGRRTMSAAKLEQKRSRLSTLLAQANSVPRLVEELNETVKGWRSYYGLSPDTKDQLALLEKDIGDRLEPWLARIRQATAIPAAELKASLLRLELPVTTDPRQKLKWAELLVARSRQRRTTPSQPLSDAARQAVETRKKELEKLKRDREELVIAEPGTYLGRTGERLLIRREGKRIAEVPLAMVRNLSILTKAFSISGDLMAETAARSINIVLAGTDGRPAVRIGPIDQPEHRLSAAQSQLACSMEGLSIARAIVAGKVRNQANLLRYYLKHSDRHGRIGFLDQATGAVKQMEQARKSLLERAFSDDIELERGRLFAAEGQAASSYWAAIRALLDPRHGFNGRLRKGATDLVNSMLNYGYGILYSRCLLVLLKTGLNIHVGFLHKPQPTKSALLYDFIEEFRTAAVDRVVFTILNLGIPVAVTAEGIAHETRRELARRILDRLKSPLRYHGEAVPLEQIMQQQARLFALRIEDAVPYKAFVLPW